MVDIYRVFHPIMSQNTFFLAANGTFSKIDILGYKASLNKFKKIEITPCFISDHNGIKLDLNSKRKTRNHSNTWRLNNTLLKKQWMTRARNQKVPRINENENTTYQNLWDRAKTMLR
jgi:hypothetical protein